MSALQKKLQGAKSLPPRPPMPQSRYQVKKRDYSPIPWTKYFDCDKEVSIPGTSDTFHYYQKGELMGPIVILLHGGGFSGLSWALFSQSLTETVECCCIALDQRGHGSTNTQDNLNLSADQLANDVSDVVECILKESLDSSNPVILIGHSMGGAIAVHAAAKQRVRNLVGLIVIDVVEGSALDSLHAMRGVLSNRPKSFESIEKANEWCTRTGYVKNSDSARVSMIGQLIKQEVLNVVDKQRETEDISTGTHQMSTIAEDEDFSEKPSDALSSISNQRPQCSSDLKSRYVWKIDLTKTSQFWEGWFKGMSSMFLSVSCPKLLLLAGVDRLDAEMTTAQMQGKFQMQIVARSGHAVHEDAPEKVAQVVAAFLIRHQFVKALGEFKRPMPAC